MYFDLQSFDRISMKCGVRKIMGHADVIQAVNAYWSDECSDFNASSSNNNDDDTLVS